MLRLVPVMRTTAIFSWRMCLVLLLFQAAQTLLPAQSDATFSDKILPEALILASPVSTNGYTVWKADSLPVTAAGSLSERLFLENALNVRQNAPGTLATLSARGAGATRTAVCWNGLNLQSPMNGVVDAALVPYWPGDRLEIVQGGYSAALGSGAMGGAVLISSALPDHPKSGTYGGFGFQAGSYGAFNGRGAIGYQADRLKMAVKGSYQQADNDFPFQKIGLDGKPYQTRQQNNAQQKTDFQQTAQWQLNDQHLLKSAVWYQTAFRQIPPSITEVASETWQADEATRALLNWTYLPNAQSSLTTQAAWLDEFINYYFAGASEKSRARTAILTSDWNQTLREKWRFSVGGSSQIVRARSDGYRQENEWFQQQRYALRSRIGFQLNKRGSVSLLARKEWAENQGAPFTWTLAAVQSLGTQWKLRGHLARNFNLPTFNDRFWKGLGQSDLLPEKGYSTDLGVNFEQQQFAVDLSVFYLILDNWILWQPGPDGLFRPGNLKKVSSRGTELKADYRFVRGKWQFKLKGQIQGSVTKNVAVYDNTTVVLGKQLPYSPNISGSAGFWISRKRVSMVALHQYTGRQFITSDQQSSLPAYQTSALMAQWSGKLFGGMVSLNVKMDNLWDVSYASLANRPMPGRNGSLGVYVQW